MLGLKDYLNLKLNIRGGEIMLDALSIAINIILEIEDLEIQERFSNPGDTWEHTKDMFMKEAERGMENPYFWSSVKEFSKILEKYYTK